MNADSLVALVTGSKLRIMHVFLFHGIEGSPDENWFPWLKKQLEAQGHMVTVPAFPHPAQPVLPEWLEAMEPYRSLINEQTVLVGHSLGALFLLSLLASLDQPIAAAFLVSGFLTLPVNDFTPPMKSFLQSFEQQRLHALCPHFAVFHGDDDPYVPLEKAQELSDFLSAPLHVIPHGGHLNAAAGYTSFPALLSAINSSLK